MGNKKVWKANVTVIDRAKKRYFCLMNLSRYERGMLRIMQKMRLACSSSSTVRRRASMMVPKISFYFILSGLIKDLTTKCFNSIKPT